MCIFLFVVYFSFLIKDILSSQCRLETIYRGRLQNKVFDWFVYNSFELQSILHFHYHNIRHKCHILSRRSMNDLEVCLIQRVHASYGAIWGMPHIPPVTGLCQGPSVVLWFEGQGEVPQSLKFHHKNPFYFPRSPG